MDRRQRHDEKLEFCILWIAEFQVSTSSILCEAMRLKRENQGHFLKSLSDKGLVQRVRHPIIKEDILILTHDGRLRASMLTARADSYSMVPSKAVKVTTIHDLSVQRAVLSKFDIQMKRDFGVTHERHIADVDRSKRPDALVDDHGSVVAVEVELTQKSSKRVYTAFFNHLDQMRAGHYERVVYFFPNDSLLSSYQKLFDKDRWPMFERKPDGKLVQKIQGGELLFADTSSPALRGRFAFSLVEQY